MSYVLTSLHFYLLSNATGDWYNNSQEKSVLPQGDDHNEGGKEDDDEEEEEEDDDDDDDDMEGEEGRGYEEGYDPDAPIQGTICDPLEICITLISHHVSESKIR